MAGSGKNTSKDLFEIPLAKLKGFKLPPEIYRMVQKDVLRGKGFEACHQLIREQSGVWIPELDPIFKELDRMLGLAPAC